MIRKSIVSIISFGFVLLLTAELSSAFAGNKGEALFELCVACHGDGGVGKKVLEAPSIAGLPSWYVKAQIEKFRNGARGAHPQDAAGLRMRPMARTLHSAADVEAVSQFVSKLKPVLIEKETVKGSVIAGEQAYQICSSCHGADAKGVAVMNAPPLIYSSDWYLLKQLQNFNHGLRGGDAAKDPNGASMKGMAATLNKQAMHDVVVYIQTLR
jgi:cytochrome c553